MDIEYPSIHTVEELQNLPFGTIIMTRNGYPLEKMLWQHVWMTPGSIFRFEAHTVALPAKLLYLGEES